MIEIRDVSTPLVRRWFRVRAISGSLWWHCPRSTVGPVEYAKLCTVVHEMALHHLGIPTQWSRSYYDDEAYLIDALRHWTSIHHILLEEGR